jgi:3-oxoacyl-[acyl-carrier protein] reductase
MDLKIEGKVAVVTAASRGLGRAAAEALAAEGVNLAICSRNEEKIADVADYIQAVYEVDVIYDTCDVTDKAGIQAFKEKVIDHYKTCHILFTNAGGPPPGKIDDFQGENFEKAVELNLFSTINLVYAFLPYMKQQKWGRILALTSISVKQPIPTLVLSNVSRAGVVAFVKSIARELGRLNITANTIAPGYIMTERVEELLQNKAENENITYDEALATIKNLIPVNKVGAPEDLGALCAFLASDYASYITGETHLIDGGMYAGTM